MDRLAVLGSIAPVLVVEEGVLAGTARDLANVAGGKQILKGCAF